jgi:hypothetical protein
MKTVPRQQTQQQQRGDLQLAAQTMAIQAG